MTTKSALEEALEFLINEEDGKAVEAFHNFIVQKARAIHESLIEDDEMDDDIDESLELDEKKDDKEVNEKDSSEEVDEAKEEEVDESKEKEEVDEDITDSRHEIRSDEYFGRDELTAEDEGDDMDDDEAEVDLGDEMGDEAGVADEVEGEVTMDADDAQDLAAALEDLSRKFAEITGVDVGDEEEADDDMGDMDDMDDMGDMGDMEGGNQEVAAEEGFGLERPGFSNPTMFGEGEEDKEVDESKDKDEVDEAVTHDPGVQKDHKTDEHGNHGSRDNIRHNDDAKLPESAEFDFDLTEEDFLDLEEGLKQVSVSMGGEQGGVKFAGEETNTKSPVADKDSSKLLGTGSKDMISKQAEHGTYKLETAPGSGDLPHSGDNSHESADQTGSPSRSEVLKGGGLDKQKGHGEGEAGAGKFAGTETNVKSPIGSQGTRNDS